MPPALGGQKFVRRAPGAVDAVVDNDLVVLNPKSSEFVALNEVAAAVWEALGDQTVTVESVIEAVLGQFDVTPERCAASVTRFINEAVAAGLMEAA